MTPDELREYIKQEAFKIYEYKEQKVGRRIVQDFEKYIILRVIDENWKDHLHQMDLLKEGIGLRAYGQKDPLVEYKQEAYHMFLDLIDTVNQKTLELLWRTEFVEAPPAYRGAPPRIMLVHNDATNMGLLSQQETATERAAKERSRKPQPVKVETKVGRNDPCPCGSGKKYKKCHGKGV